MLKNTAVGVVCVFCCLAVGWTSVPASQAQTVSGAIFRDYDGDGQADSAEPGVAGLTVEVFDDSGGLVGSATSQADGTYSATLTVGGGVPVRVELSGLPDFLRPGPVGPSASPHTAFAQSGDGGIDFGVANPAQHCQVGAPMVAPCYVNGDPLTTPAGACPGGGTAAEDFEAFVAFPEDADSADGTGVVRAATAGALGAVWGVAWQRSSGSVFTAATVKRHVGLGPLPSGSAGSRTGVIYRLTGDFTTDDGAVVEPWFNLDDIPGVDTGAEPSNRGLDACSTEPNYDPNSFDAVGKVGLGDLDISDDDRTLWVVNLFDRTLYELTIGDPPAVPDADSVTAHPLGAAEPTCNGGVFRPWALSVHDGLVYVGGVCTGEAGGAATDLTAHVLAHDPAGAVGNFSEVFQMDLDYPRGKVSDQGSNEPLALWRPWIDQWSDITGPAPDSGPFGQTLFPQPMLTDITFDVDGSMILGFLDRAGQQLGNENFQTDGVDTTTFEGVVAGDVLRVCFDAADGNGDGSPFVLEIDSACPGGAGPTLTADQTPPQGPGGREYYWTDYFRWDNNPNAPNAGTHQEISLGGLAHRFGSQELAASAFDPFDDFRAGGIIWMSHVSGARTHSLEVFGLDEGGQPATFGKASGIGDLEILCQPAPLELGDRVWCDSDGDGAQDPGEAPVPGVDVSLQCGADATVTTTTDGAGRYLFTDASYMVVNGTPIPRDANCSLTLDRAASEAAFLTACGGPVVATTVNSGVGSSPDLNDSDGTDVGGGIVQIPHTTGGAGDNDHSLDFGFTGLLGSIGDTVWCDGIVGAGNGVFDAGEGIPGVTVELFQDSDCDDTADGPALASQATTGDGQYSFSNLSVGSSGDPVCYVVRVDAADPDLGLCNLPITPTERQPDLDSDNPDDPTNDFAFEEPCVDDDGDGVCNESCVSDRDGDGVPDCSDSDPQGFIYCEENGEILPGGSIAVGGPGAVTITEDGSSGRYAFTTDGTPGTYTLSVTPPQGLPLSSTCTPQGSLDPTGGADPLVLGAGEVGDSGILSAFGCSDNPFHLTFELESGDPIVINNNIPLSSCGQAVIEVPTSSPWGLVLLASLLAVAAGFTLRRVF